MNPSRRSSKRSVRGQGEIGVVLRLKEKGNGSSARGNALEMPCISLRLIILL